MSFDVDPVARCEARIWQILLDVDQGLDLGDGGTSRAADRMQERLRELDAETHQAPPDAANLPAGIGLANLDMMGMLWEGLAAGPSYILELGPDSRPVANAEARANEAELLALGRVLDLLESWSS